MITQPAYRKTSTGRLGKLRTWIAAAAVCLTGVFATLPAEAAPAEAAQPVQASVKLTNKGCQECHDGRKGKLESKNADGDKRELLNVDPAKFEKGVHSKMQCVTCHTNIVDNKSPHKIDPKLKKPDCASCHVAEWDKIKKAGKTKEKARMGKVVESIDEYKKSFHARENSDDETRPNASCNECHNVHSFDIPPKGTDEHAAWRVSDSAKTCGTNCHEDQLEEFNDSIHGEKLQDEEDEKAATCFDCHTSHSVGNSSAVTVKQQILESCGECHEDQYKSFERTKHAKLATHAGGNTIRCMDCHGSHGVFMVAKLKDPRKMVKQDNKMCISCHESDKKFEKFAPLKKGGKEGEKVARQNLDEQHEWLPNTKLHWNSVRCIDCHTSAEASMSHEILGEKKAERNCVSCHSKDSSLATRLYRHLSEEEKQKYGFVNSIILANSYVIGATRHALLDTLIVAMAALTFLGVLGHGAARYFSAKSRRKNGK